VSTQLSPATAGSDPRTAWSPPIPTSVTTADAEVAVVRWPAEATIRDTMAALHLPRLLVVQPGAAPPEDLGPEEDWVRWPPDPHEMLLRAQHLAARARSRAEPAALELDDDGVVRRGDRWVSLSPAQGPVLRLLLDHADRVVPFDDVTEVYRAAGGSDHPASVRTVLSRIDAKVRPLGVQVASVRRRGIVLRTGLAPP
jgi:hypothetical protein